MGAPGGPEFGSWNVPKLSEIHGDLNSRLSPRSPRAGDRKGRPRGGALGYRGSAAVVVGGGIRIGRSPSCDRSRKVAALSATRPSRPSAEISPSLSISLSLSLSKAKAVGPVMSRCALKSQIIRVPSTRLARVRGAPPSIWEDESRLRRFELVDALAEMDCLVLVSPSVLIASMSKLCRLSMSRGIWPRCPSPEKGRRLRDVDLQPPRHLGRYKTASVPCNGATRHHLTRRYAECHETYVATRRDAT